MFRHHLLDVHRLGWLPGISGRLVDNTRHLVISNRNVALARLGVVALLVLVLLGVSLLFLLEGAGNLGVPAILLLLAAGLLWIASGVPWSVTLGADIQVRYFWGKRNFAFDRIRCVTRKHEGSSLAVEFGLGGPYPFLVIGLDRGPTISVACPPPLQDEVLQFLSRQGLSLDSHGNRVGTQ